MDGTTANQPNQGFPSEPINQNAAPAQPTPVENPTPVIPPKSSGGGKMFLAILITLLVIAVLAAVAYFMGYINFGSRLNSQVMTEPTPVVTPVENMNATGSGEPMASPSGNLQTPGTVTGKICYPAEVIPAGEIDAKDTTTGKTYTQSYPGTAAGGKTTYTFNLIPGIYHLKLMTSQTVSGYYTECAKSPTNDVCSQDTNHKNIDVKVTSGQTTTGIDLCDFYWTQAQKTSLDSTF